MTVKKYTSPYLSSIMYVVEENGHAFIIDPYPEASLLSNQLTIDFVLLTHEHFDHISGVSFFSENCGCPILCGEKCGEKLGNPRKNMSAYYDIFTSMPEFSRYDINAEHVEPISCKADRYLADGELTYWQGSHILKAIHTPGHTAGGVSYLLDDSILFSGDTLFLEHNTQTRFPSGSIKSLRITADKLLELPQDIRVYPGHFSEFVLRDRFDYLTQISKGCIE